MSQILPPDLEQQSDFPESFLPLDGHLRWTDNAPSSLQEQSDWSPEGAAWQQWCKHLSSRRTPRKLERLWSHGECPLQWSRPAIEESRDDLSPLELVVQSWIKNERWAHHAIERLTAQVNTWLVDSAVGGERLAYDALAFAYALPKLVEQLAPQTWWALLGRLIDLSTEPRGDEQNELGASWQVMAGELPLTLAYLFPEIENTQELGDRAGEVLSAGINELLDEAALPRAGRSGVTPAALVNDLHHLLASWYRCRTLLPQSPAGCWDESTQTRLVAAAQNLFRLSRDNGTLAWSDTSASAPHALAWLQRQVEAHGDRLTRRMAAAAVSSDRPSASSADPLTAPVHGERSRLSVLRANWSPRTPRVFVLDRGATFHLELDSGREVLLSGPVESEVVWNGEQLAPQGVWNTSCWISDDDVDYLELELHLSQGVRVERHLLLSRTDHFFFWADAVIGPNDAAPPAQIAYRAWLPLAPGVAFQGEKQTREGVLVGRKPRAKVMPLALGEWRRDTRWGELTSDESALILCQSNPAGQALFAPLWFDLRSQRFDKPCTWRQLTVAEEREVVGRDMAVGYRVQVGKRNWLVYRSLFNRMSRTLLGHHLFHEFLTARFTRRGVVEPLIAIERDDA